MNSGKGILIYEYPPGKLVDSTEDNIAFGFMTEEKDGVLYRLESSVSGEFIEFRMVSGSKLFFPDSYVISLTT